MTYINIIRFSCVFLVTMQMLGCQIGAPSPEHKNNKQSQNNHQTISAQEPRSSSPELVPELATPSIQPSDPDSHLPTVTIAVATYTQRNMFHKLLHETFLRQDYPADKIDLLIYENGPIKSPYFSNSKFERVRYEHTNNAKDVLGVKRNWLVANAKGNIVVVFDDDDFYASNYVRNMVNTLLENPDQKILKIQNWVMLNYTSNAESDDPNAATPSFSFVYPYQAREYGWGFSFVFWKDVFPACQYAPRTRAEEDPFAHCIETKFGPNALRRLKQNNADKQLVLKIDSKRRILNPNNYSNRNVQREIKADELNNLYDDKDINFALKYIKKSNKNKPDRL